MKLSELKDGQRGRIKDICLSEENSRRLFYMGIYQGAIIQRLQTAPLKDPILFAVNGMQLVLRREQCLRIEVEGVE